MMDFYPHSVPYGTGERRNFGFYQHFVPDGTENTNFCF